jgi:PAS domain S-box-containing protein
MHDNHKTKKELLNEIAELRRRIAESDQSDQSASYCEELNIEDLGQPKEIIIKNRRFLTDIIEHSGTPIFIKDCEGRYELVNEKWEEVTGLRRLDTIGRTDEELFPGPVGERFRNNDQEVIASGLVMEREEFLEDEHGRRSFVSIKFPLRGDDNTINGICGIITEITARKKMEEELAISRNRLSRAEIISRSGNWEFDMKSGFVFASEGARRIYGLLDSKWTIPEVQKIPLPECRDMLDNALRNLIKENRPYDVEFKIKRPDTGEIVDIHSVAEYDSHKKLVFGIIRDITDRKRAEEALRESEIFNRILFESNRTAIVVMDVNTNRCIDCNPAAVEIYKYKSREEVIGKTPLDVSADIQYDGTPSSGKARHYIETADKNGFVAFEWLHRRPDGQCWDAMVHLVSFELRGRRLMQFSLYDITEQKKTEEALKQAEAKYRTIFQDAGIGIFQTTMQGFIVIANMALARIFGYDSPQELIDSITDIGNDVYVNPDDRLKLMEMCRKNIFVERFETRFYRKDRSVTWVSVNARAVKDSNGSILYLEGTIEDITARKHAEEELYQAHQRLFDIIEFLPDATFVIDDQKRVVAWNLACEEITGVKKEEIIGKGDYVYSIPFYGEKRPILIDYVTMDSRELAQKYSSIRKKGNILYAEAIVPKLYKGKGAYLSGISSPLFDREGRMVGAIESIRDLTEFKQLENQLRQSQKMEAIGTLAGGIAHDFNNILTALIGYATLLKMNTENATLCSYIDQILFASQKATDLTRSLLTFSKQQIINPKPVNINNIIKGTEKLLKRLVTEDIAIKTVLADEDIIIMADATQIDQILFNLVTNARDAMSQGGTITIKTETVELDDEFRHLYGHSGTGRYVLLSFSDTGRGMDEETRERIFDPFFTTKEAGKGTGLGLSTVYGIVKQHGGYIIVFSELDAGTIFHVYLPVVKEIDEEKESVPAPVKGGRETILVAEDDEEVRGLIKAMLAKYGYNVVVSIDGEDAIEQFIKTDKVDILIFDTVMPKKNGREAYNEIRKIRPDIKIIFISGYTRDIFIGKGIEDEKFNFLQKPVVPDVLLKKVREVLDKDIL